MLADGGFEPVCTGASYGPRYEAAETRCDGVDNDCDGETDRHWAVLHPRSPFSTWSVPAARLDAGYVVLAHELDGGVALRRFDDQLEPLGAAEALQLSDAGYLASERLLLTRQGATLVYVQTPDYQAPVSAFFAPLSGEGVRLRDAQGGPQLSQVGAEPLPGWGLRAAASLDGTRVMLAFHAAASDAASPEPQELLAVVTDALGKVLTGPTRLMRVEADGQARTLYQQSVVGESSGFVLVASESVVGTQAQTLRLQRYSSTLEPVGEER
ncbi:MAG TPA: putative metal-binding motif-containing protein, partial [Aggregicoccus sp.]|nr:putative metal-binding motif-containing protein [Aggregicoccus sp.]